MYKTIKEYNVTIQAVSFGKQSYTNNGNKYNKTNVMGYTGLAVGGGISAYTGYKLFGHLKAIKPEFHNAIISNYEKRKKLIPDLPKPTEEQITSSFKALKKQAILCYGISTAIVLGIAFALGKTVDFIINKIRAKNADKPVMLKQKKIDG